MQKLSTKYQHRAYGVMFVGYTWPLQHTGRMKGKRRSSIEGNSMSTNLLSLWLNLTSMCCRLKEHFLVECYGIDHNNRTKHLVALRESCREWSESALYCKYASTLWARCKWFSSLSNKLEYKRSHPSLMVYQQDNRLLPSLGTLYVLMDVREACHFTDLYA